MTSVALESPYVGLDYYTEEDSHIFFGREAERRKIIANLRTARLTLLYAPSGVGKSSLLRAGVAARLQTLARERPPGDLSRYVPVVFGSWSDDPVAGLQARVEAAVASFAPGPLEHRDAESLESTLEHAVSAIDATMLVILDQFEEYFLYHAGEEAFAEDLAKCVNRPDLRVRVLIAVRDDAYSMLGDLFKGRIANVYGNYLQLGYLGREAAGDAIRKPLERYNELRPNEPPVVIEEELVDAVLDQVRTGRVVPDADGGRGAAPRSAGGAGIETPYLQLVMKRLWNAETSDASHTLRLSTLTRLGGAEAIVRTHLDGALGGLPERQRDLAADLFHYLITPSRTKIAHDVQSLAEYTGHSENEVGELLEALSGGDTRIVRTVPPPPGRTGGPRYEVFHDVLATPILDWRARRRAKRLEDERRRLEVRSTRLLAGLIAVAAIAVTLMIYVVSPGLFQRLDLRTIDARFGVRGNSTPADVVLVGIDRASLAALVDPASGLVRRTAQARAIDEIWRGHPAVIAEDIGYLDVRAGDAQLFDAIRRARGHVVLAAVTLNSDADTTLFGHDPAGQEGGTEFVRGLGAEPGYVGVSPDQDRRLRHFQSSAGVNGSGGPRMVTLPVAAARRAGAQVPDFGNAWIDYRGGPGTIPRVSFLDVVRGRVSPGRFRGKIVIVGATAPGLDDHPTPAGGGTTMPGAEILANAAWTARHGLPLVGHRGIDFVAIALLGLVPLCLLFLRPLPGLLACVLAAGLFLVAVQLAFDAGLIVSVIYPLLALVLSTLGVLVTQIVSARLRARRV